MKTIDPNKIWVGDVVLVATGTDVTIRVQKKLNYGESSQWTHVAGSIGGYDLIEGQIPKSRVCNIQKDYVEKGMAIKVMRKKFEKDGDRIKVALWWATMNNVPYDYFQLTWFPFLAWVVGNSYLFVRNIFNSRKRLICSELVINGFYKQGYNLFNKPAANVLPADFDDPKIFTEVTDVWMDSPGAIG